MRPIAMDELDEIARIHMLAFPESALTALGHSCVRRYYEWQLIGPHDALAIAVVADGAITGFCFGGIFRGALSGYLRTNRIYLAWRVATRPWLLARRLFRGRAVLALKAVTGRLKRRGARNAGGIPHPVAPRAFGILSIAVHPTKAGSGLGRSLMESMERAARERGFARMGLTVSPDNARAVRFYEQLGWTRETPAGAWRGGMSKRLPAAPG